jgi:hypothetical protein
MTACNYYDAGWCYAPDDVETSASSQSACFDYDFCPYLKSQMSQPVQYETPMTEIEELKAQLKVLEKKIALLEEIEKQPRMELLKDGSVYCVEYNTIKYYRNHYRHSNGWVKWWRENDEGDQLTRVDDPETFRLLEQLFAADISANPQGSLKFTFGPTLGEVIDDWWSDIFTTNSNDDMETSVDDLIERIKKWLPKPQSASGSQSISVEDTVEGWNDCLETIKRKLG